MPKPIINGKIIYTDKYLLSYLFKFNNEIIIDKKSAVKININVNITAEPLPPVIFPLFITIKSKLNIIIPIII